jgi:hypothetical protein
MLPVPQEASVGHNDRGDRSEPLDHLSCFVELSHLGEARGEKPIRQRQAGIFLDHKAQFWHRLIETPTDEMGSPEIGMRPAGTGARAETQSGTEMIDRDVWLARP